MNKFIIPATMLSPEIDPSQLGFTDTSTLIPLEEPLGQARAVESLDFGLAMKSHGFNIYASGPKGTGKWTIVRQRISQLPPAAQGPPDWCYVNNFRDPTSPRCLSFPPAEGRKFKQAIAALIQYLRRTIPTSFESSKYLDARAKIIEEREQKKQTLFFEIEKNAMELGFGFKEEPVGFSLVPLRDGKPMTEEDKAKLTESQREHMTACRKTIEGKIREFQAKVHALDHESEHQLTEMDRQIVRAVLENQITLLKAQYQEMPEVLDYINQVEQDVISNHREFLPKEAPPLPIFGMEAPEKKPDFTRYEVNLVVEQPGKNELPIVDETHPTYANLIGKIERRSHLGVVFTDFMQIRTGSCLKANGGYLILNALDVLRQPFAWDALKRTIKTRSLKIEDPGDFFGFTTTGLNPQPIPVNIKVILLGSPQLIHLLQRHEEDFSKLFKVKADFDVDVPRDQLHQQLYGRFIVRLCQEESLPHFKAEAVGEIIRQGLRIAERRDRLSLRLSLIGDLVREAAYWAQQHHHPLVTREDVDTAIAEKRRRSNLPEEWIQNEIKEGTLMVDLSGEVVGQVNGLSVHQLGDYSFGRPCRITARTFVGNKGVIDIQREVELAGEIHSKGVMTLAGYLAGTFATFQPFALSATLTFEQTYSEVEGDSAAVAELIALLSSLSNIPIRQYLAVTGSVNQLGEIQPIGGLNEKIEGFFEACRQQGLTGNQGVIIPARNTKHLVVSPEVVKAAEAGTFVVYGVNRIEEAIELLTGMPAGTRQPNGQFPDDTLFGLVSRRLQEMADIGARWEKTTE